LSKIAMSDWWQQWFSLLGSIQHMLLRCVILLNELWSIFISQLGMLERRYSQKCKQ
jgi:hypothetical protein